MKRTLLFGLILALALVPMAGLAQPAEAGGPYYGSGYNCIYHTVRPGETLSGIAAYYGVNMWTLAQRNGISNPNHIYAGQRLVIRCNQPPPPPPPPPPPYPQPCPPPQHPCPPQPYPPPHPPHPYPPQPPHPSCSIMPQHGFGRIWYHNPGVSSKLGCPTEGEVGFSGGEQYHHQGNIIQDHDAGVAYVLYNNHTWTTKPPVQCPYQMHATRQSYQGGTMIWTPYGGIYVLYNDGTWQHYD